MSLLLSLVLLFTNLHVIKRGRGRALLSLSKTAEEEGRITNYREFCGGTMEYILGNIINVNVQNELLELRVIATKVKEKQQG